jgi:hypothetical protein
LGGIAAGLSGCFCFLLPVVCTTNMLVVVLWVLQQLLLAVRCFGHDVWVKQIDARHL